MDNFDILVLRIVHIAFGTFWVGSSFFRVLVLEPRLQALGFKVRDPVMGAIGPVIGRTQNLAGVITIVAGVILLLRLRWGHLDTVLETGWGWAMLIGFITAVTASVAGSFGPGGWRNSMAGLRQSYEGREPTAEEAAELERLATLSRRGHQVRAMLMLISIGSMAVARFV